LLLVQACGKEVAGGDAGSVIGRILSILKIDVSRKFTPAGSRDFAFTPVGLA
jgi:hypothetical protein